MDIMSTAMHITIWNLVSKGYLLVSQQLKLVDGLTQLDLYVDSDVVSFEYRGKIIQCTSFNGITKHLRLSKSVWFAVRTMDNITMDTIRRRYIDDFQRKFGITDIVTTYYGTTIEVASEYAPDLNVLKKSIQEYHPSLGDFHITYY